MTARKFRKAWWVDFRFRLERYRLKSPENSRAGAKAYELYLRNKLASGEPFVTTDKKFKDFAWEWFETYVKTNNKDSEISRKKYALRSSLIPFFGNIPIDKIPTQQVEEYKAKQLKAHLKPKTINNQLTVLSSCLRTAQDWYDFPKLPKIKKLKVSPQNFKFLSYEECDLLLTQVKGIWYELILTALKTGLRLGELKALRFSDINWNNKTLTVNHSWCEYKNGLIAPKSNKERHIPMTHALYEILLKRNPKKGYIFTDKRGRQFNSKQLNRELANVCKKIGIKEVTCHTLRHTFASHLVMSGAPLKAIQELLGHASITTTMIYAHLAPSSLRSAVNLLELNPENFGQPAGNGVQYPINILPLFKTQNPELALFKATDER